MSDSDCDKGWAKCRCVIKVLIDTFIGIEYQNQLVIVLKISNMSTVFKSIEGRIEVSASNVICY